MSIYSALVPYYNSDKDDSDTESSSLLRDNKTKHSTDQKVPDKKLPSAARFDPSDQVSKEITPKKCLVLKPQNDDSPPIIEQEKDIVISTRKCLVLKPIDEEEPLEIETESETYKKCLVRIPKVDCENNISKVVSYSIEGKDTDKKNRRRENGISESDNKSKTRFDHGNYNGLVLQLI